MKVHKILAPATVTIIIILFVMATIIIIIIIIIIKMAIILPTGQWYAPSAVTNDAWYCMV